MRTPTTADRLHHSIAAPIIISTTSRTDLNSGSAFKNWNYALVTASLDRENSTHSKSTDQPAELPNFSKLHSDSHNGCIDSGCGDTLIDRKWLMDQLPHARVMEMAMSLKARAIGTSNYEIDEYVVQPLYLPATDEKGGAATSSPN